MAMRGWMTLARCSAEPIEAEGVDTIGGLVFNRLGYLPKPGTSLNIDNLSITVRRISRKRIEELLIEPNQSE